MSRHTEKADSGFRQGGWVAALLAVGVLARFVRYLACFPLWEAEAYAAATLVDRSFSGLARPLDYQTVCPLGFLWVEWLAVRLLGCSEYALRFFPLFCGIGSLFLFAWASFRILEGPARLFSIGMLAVAYQLIRNSAECRQYASDLFFASLLVALGVGYLTAGPGRRKRWWAGLAAAIPVALLFSLPAAFVAAGVIVASGWSGRIEERGPSGEASSRPAFLTAALAAVLLTSFAVLWFVHLRRLLEAARSAGALYLTWQDAFPPLSDPGRLPLWLFETHTGRMFAYPTGGPHFGSLLTTTLFVLGIAEVWRRRRTTLLLLVTTPFLAGLAAAALRLYPYGANDRLVVYLAPSICLMAGLGAATLLARLPTAEARRRAFVASALVLAAFGLGVAVDSVLRPYKDIEDERGRIFAKSFWQQMAAGGEAASLKSDLHIQLEPDAWLWASTGFRATFHYYRAAYGPPAWRPDDPRWRRVGPGHPLRAVAWTAAADNPPESEAAWLASISRQYALVRKQVLPLNARSVYLVYELLPVVPVPSPLAPFPPG